MGKTIAIVNQKGGAGKTTTATNLAKTLAVNNNKVLLVDLDPLSSLATRYHIESQSLYSLADCMEGRTSLGQCIQPSGTEGFAIALGNHNLIGFEIIAMHQENRESILALQIDDLKTRYDYVLIDTPSSLGLLTMNALVAADEVLIPIKCDYTIFDGMAELLRTIDDVSYCLNAKLKIMGFLVTHVNPQLRSTAVNLKEIRTCYGESVLHTLIPDSDDLEDSFHELATELEVRS
ncbi:MAG: ParA family protein [Bacteroidaceae bacterium]|nr:ParA family protein [Bacteroidaceae bacterium]